MPPTHPDQPSRGRRSAAAAEAHDPQVFLLSPASLSGVRGRRLLEGRWTTARGAMLHEGASAPLAEVYTAISSLYFRGKLGYARRFARRGAAEPGVLAITPNRGLLDVDTHVNLADMHGFAATSIGADEPDYVDPLLASARVLRESLPEQTAVVLLGSIASRKYVEPLCEVFGSALLVPSAFVGRGDMSRGGLLLRAVSEGCELAYVPALTADRHGKRPPRLAKLPRPGRGGRANGAAPTDAAPASSGAGEGPGA